MNLFRPSLEEGFTRAGSKKDISNFDIAPTVQVQLGADVEACRNAVKPNLALYIGGMGARERNFYYNLACRYGYADAALRIQDLYLKGRKGEAAASVPDALVDEVAVVEFACAGLVASRHISDVKVPDAVYVHSDVLY